MVVAVSQTASFSDILSKVIHSRDVGDEDQAEICRQYPEAPLLAPGIPPGAMPAQHHHTKRGARGHHAYRFWNRCHSCVVTDASPRRVADRAYARDRQRSLPRGAARRPPTWTLKLLMRRCSERQGTPSVIGLAFFLALRNRSIRIWTRLVPSGKSCRWRAQTAPR